MISGNALAEAVVADAGAVLTDEQQELIARYWGNDGPESVQRALDDGWDVEIVFRDRRADTNIFAGINLDQFRKPDIGDRPDKGPSNSGGSSGSPSKTEKKEYPCEVKLNRKYQAGGGIKAGVKLIDAEAKAEGVVIENNHLKGPCGPVERMFNRLIESREK